MSTPPTYLSLMNIRLLTPSNSHHTLTTLYFVPFTLLTVTRICPCRSLSFYDHELTKISGLPN